ncbi:trypsin-like peptidase domain-containing protein [Streptomyces nigrescens]|uniref:trypsin-like peptidase domain-containing protein n=1 Tax=Streptomyces nigrescens TaxID=1920 RepID=UPI0036A8E3EE
MAVIATLPGGREQIGSGFLVQGRQVLTAAHCTHDKKTGATSIGLQVVRASDGATARVDGLVAAPELDVAVLRLTHAPWEADLPAPAFARVDRTRSGVLRDCAAIGFPLFQRDPVHRARHTAELHGTIYQTDERETGRLLMREPLLTPREPTTRGGDGDRDLPTPGKNGDREPTDLVWGGLSGALVFHAGRAIGVIVQHHPRQGASAVQLVAFDTLRKHAETDPDAQQVADALQLPPVEQLDMAAAEAAPPLLGLVDVIDDTSGDLPRVRDLDPYRLGATTSDYGGWGTYGKHDPYVPRTGREVDAHLRAALEPTQFVLLVGPAKVGKTRTAFEALHAAWQDARLAAPTPKRLAKLADHPRLRGSSDPLVVWLDDLDRFLTTSKPLNPARLTALLGRPGPTVVVATLRQEARLRLREATGELARDTEALLKTAVTIELWSTTEDPDEQAAAQAAYPDQPMEGTGLAERLGYAPDLLMTYRDAQTANPVLHAVVRTAIDWARTGLSRPIPQADLLEIADSALVEENPAHQITRKEISNTIKQARRPRGSGTTAALLLTELLPEPAEGRKVRGYRAYDYLVAADDGQAGPPRPVPEQAWQEALGRADDMEAFGVGLAADQRGNRPVSFRAFEQTARTGDTDAMFALGLLEHRDEPPDLNSARHWYEKAANAGNTRAMVNLGGLLEHDWLDLDGARHWYEKAANAGETKAMSNLGRLLANHWEPPDLEGARHWLEEAANAGYAIAMLNLGLLEDQSEPPNRDGARHWYEQAALAGNTDALFLLTQREDLDGTRHWYEKVAQAGNTDAMVALGLLLTQWEPPDLDGARHWYEKAANAGNTKAMPNLGWLLERHWEDLDGARHWYEKAANASNSEAMFLLGMLLEHQWEPPDLGGARNWYEKAAHAGSSEAMVALGLLLSTQWEPPGLDSARHWWEEVAQAGRAKALVALASVLAVNGETDEACAFLQQAVEAGHPGASAYAAALDTDSQIQSGARTALNERVDGGDFDALNFLGILEWRIGNLGAAHSMWALSRDAGDVVAALLLRMTSG